MFSLKLFLHFPKTLHKLAWWLSLPSGVGVGRRSFSIIALSILSELLNLSSIDVLGQIILYCWGWAIGVGLS